MIYLAHISSKKFRVGVITRAGLSSKALEKAGLSWVLREGWKVAEGMTRGYLGECLPGAVKASRPMELAFPFPLPPPSSFLHSVVPGRLLGAMSVWSAGDKW